MTDNIFFGILTIYKIIKGDINMTPIEFLHAYSWLLVAVCSAIVSFVVIYGLFRMVLSAKLAPIEDRKESRIKIWITLALTVVLTAFLTVAVNWVASAHVSWVWYALGCTVGALLSLVLEFKKSGLKLTYLVEEGAKVTAELEGVREVARKAGIVDDAKFEKVMAEVNAEIASKFGEIEKAKDEKTKQAFVDALVGFLVKDGTLDETDIKVLKANGVTTEEISNSQVMFDFLNK